ncbi:beta-xylosidase [Paramyrothecium foliicola]|nr:beta-xylosidase [Paramyrothecium foliicola]
MARLFQSLVAACAIFGHGVSALKNPLIPGWNPDPHVLRVEDTYYVAVSSFLTFPGVPIYSSKDLANWELVSHALDSPSKVPLHGIRQDNGVWAPSLHYIDGLFYMTSMAMWGSDPSNRTWPRIFWVTSPDLKTWSDVIWAEPYGIDPHLFQDPKSGKAYLSIMGLNNPYERYWGISQCEVNLESGKCTGPYRRVWNGTLPSTQSARPEGPKLFYKEPYYYMILAEGGTGITHRATIGRSDSPEGPWESSPTNPLLFNGANTNLTIGNTGHATFSNTPDGKWFATFLAKRYVDGVSVLGREAFFAPVEWRDDGWPVVNDGEFVLPSQEYDIAPTLDYPRSPFEDHFTGNELDSSWYQLRSPYTKNYEVGSTQGSQGACNGSVVLRPNVFTLGDRDSPAAILRKQTSVNMTFVATLLPTDKSLGTDQAVGVSVYSSERTHQILAVRGCANSTGQCLRVDSAVNLAGPGTLPVSKEFPFGSTIPKGTKLHIRAEPRLYRMGYSIGNASVEWVHEFPARSLPVGFDGAMLALYASGNGHPWPFDAPEVGFTKIREEYFEEGFEDYQ